MAVNQSTQYGSYVVTTNVWDVGQIDQIDVNSKQFKELLVRLYQNINLIANTLNVKDTGVYNNSFPIVCGQQYFPNPTNNSSTTANPTLRNVFRTVINFGALPNTTTKSIAHGITCTSATTFTRIYATASDTSGKNYISIPFTDITLTANQISLTVDATNVNITTGSNRSNFNICYVILEYLIN